MTTYEGGVRVISMLHWPGVIKPGQLLNGIQAHQDMFTTLAAAAGVADVAEQMKTKRKQNIDGLNNLAYWKGETDQSARTYIFHYNESKLAAMRMGPWKWHFSTSKDYYDTLVGRSQPKLYKLRMDPFESYSSVDACGHLLQKVSWLVAPVSEMMKQNLQTNQYPPVQGGRSFDTSNVVEQILSNGQE